MIRYIKKVQLITILCNNRHGFLAQKVQMAGSEPLIQGADPHITKLANRSSDVGKDGSKKILWNVIHSVLLVCVYQLCCQIASR